MYARIVNNEIAELDGGNRGGEAGWKEVPADDVGKDLKYDTGTSSVRAKTDAEITAEISALKVKNAWAHLRKVRNNYLENTGSL